MAEPIRAELQFVRKHITRYLHANLHPLHGLTLPNSTELRQMVALHLTAGFAVRVDHLIPHDTLHTPTNVQLIAELPPLTPKLHNDLLDAITSMYNQEFCRAVDHLHLIMRVPLHRSVETFRMRYGITEDDYPLRTSLRTYNRYLRKRGIRRRSGRPVLPADLLKCRRTRELERQRPTLFDPEPPEQKG
jgi:hypothetical protein